MKKYLYLLALCSPALAADTVQDFTAEFFPPPSLAAANTRFDRDGSEPSASWFDGSVNGWDGGYVQLTDTVGSQNNAISINDSTGDGWESLIIDFDFRGLAGDGNGADGFGLLLFPTSVGADTSTPPPNWGEAEEPNFAGSFGLGLDTYGNAAVGQADEFVGDGEGSVSNHTSLHWNGASITQDTTVGTVLPEFLLGNTANDFIRGQLTLDAVNDTASLRLDAAEDGLGTNVLQQYTNFSIPGLVAFDARIALRGRTGGANELIQFDNIVATRVDAGGAETTVIDEDFSEAPSTPNQDPAVPQGGSAYIVETISGDPSQILTEGTFMESGNGVAPGVMLVVKETGSQHNNIMFDQTSNLTGLISGSFDFGGSNANSTRADGISFVLADVDTYGASGGVGNFGGEEPNMSNLFGIGIDTHPGGIDDNTNDNHLSVHWNGTFLARVEIDKIADFDIISNQTHTLDFTLTAVAGGYLLDLAVTDSSDGSVTSVWEDYLIAGMTFGAGGARAGFSGRTGGDSDNYLIDNVNISFLDTPAELRITDIDYLLDEGDGTADVTLTWESELGKSYAVDFTNNFRPDGGDPAWEELIESVASGGATTQYTNADIPAGTSMRFYRVRELPPVIVP